MGWTFFNPRGRDTVALVTDAINCDNEHASWKVLDTSLKGSTVYAVVEYKRKDGREDHTYIPDADGTVRFIAVFLTRRERGEFGYKDMCESMGPYESDCPARLIAKASPLREDDKSYAADWRKRCAENAAKKREGGAKKRTLTDGMTVKFAEPIRFTSGMVLDTFKVATITRRGRKTRIFVSGGAYYRIPNIDRRDFTIQATA